MSSIQINVIGYQLGVNVIITNIVLNALSDRTLYGEHSKFSMPLLPHLIYSIYVAVCIKYFALDKKRGGIAWVLYPQQLNTHIAGCKTLDCSIILEMSFFKIVSEKCMKHIQVWR